MSDFHMSPDEALKFADSIGNLKDLVFLEVPKMQPLDVESSKLMEPIGLLPSITNLPRPHASPQMVNVHLTDSGALPIAVTLSKENPKMQKVNFGENGLGAEVKKKIGKLFETTHKGFILDSYG